MSINQPESNECARTACRNSPATEFNHSTRMMYCESCAHLIQDYENSQVVPSKIFDKFFRPKGSKT